MWVRIDNRLVHGQIIETWIPYTGAQVLIVANDEIAADRLRQDIMSLAIPQHIEVFFSTIDTLSSFFKRHEEVMGEGALVLFSSCLDARRAYEHGVGFDSLNIGNLHYSPGKKQVCAHVALSTEDETCLEFFTLHGVKLDFRCVPNDPVQVRVGR